MLVIAETHPVQYHAPVYRAAAQKIPLVVIYGSDFSLNGYRDREFGQTFAWDTDLMSGYDSRFLSRVAEGGPTSYESVRADALEACIRPLKPAATLVLGYASPFDRKAIRVARRCGGALLLRGETTDHARRRSWSKRLFRDVRLRRLYSRCSRLLYVGQRSLHHFRRLGVPEDRLVFSPYCVNTSEFRGSEVDRAALRASTRCNLGLPDEAILVLFSGKLVSRKGVDLLPTCIRMLPAEIRTKIVLAFLGEGELRESLRAAASAEPQVAMRFLGFQNQSKLDQFYHAADLLVLPSREGETWGLVVNEALHHGVPVVASSSVGSTSDLVRPGMTGEICASDCPRALARAITDVLPLIGRKDVREKCRRIVAGYDVAAAASGIITAYNSLMQ